MGFIQSCQDCLHSGVRLTTSLREEAERVFRRKRHTNASGSTEWIEGKRESVEVVCVDNAMVAGG